MLAGYELRVFFFAAVVVTAKEGGSTGWSGCCLRWPESDLGCVILEMEFAFSRPSLFSAAEANLTLSVDPALIYLLTCWATPLELHFKIAWVLN